MVYKKFKIPLYYGSLHIAICNDVEKEIEDVRKKFYVNTDEYDFAGYSEATENHYLILLNKKHLISDDFAIGTLAHEAFHVTSFVMKRVGIKADVNNDEAQAYLLSWIIEQTYKLFKKTTNGTV